MKKWISLLVIAIVVIALSVGGILGAREFYFKEKESDDDMKTAENGDNVKIHYTGMLKDERVYNGWRVFDTSYEKIPEIKDPKFTMTYNSERERGDPFNFTLGQGDVIEGWDENVKGMEEGESRVFEVPPEKGYGKKSDELIFEVNKTETVAVYQTIDRETFQNDYGQPATNMVVEDKFWGWEKVVISVEQDTVQVRNDPDVGDVYNAYSEEGWTSEVLSIDSNANGGEGLIEVQHELNKPTVVDSERLGDHEQRFEGIPNLKQRNGQTANGEGIAMNDEGKIVIDFNDEVTGTTLVFRVEVVSIVKGE
ncbi:MAG: FKBP-type peptidyl-prolyl cis-trans isomerase [Candidatus Thermoplasmatota archaeon]|nr:FKBP-type peptidyl-prolyl cis-trans isomerase [Candidatus Thermoplasmatota archaeon]